MTLIALLLALVLASPGLVLGQSTRGEAPEALLGRFVDDYGVDYEIADSLWQHGRRARYEIVEWSLEGRYLLARNHAENPSDAGLWTRIDWVELTGSDYSWAYCYTVFDAPTVEAARLAEQARVDTPRTGCNGYPFTRMMPVSGR